VSIGCDLHTRYQQIALVDTDTGEMLRAVWNTGTERRERLWRAGRAGASGDRSHGYTHGSSATGGVGHELWMGDAAKIRRQCAQAEEDARDAAHWLTWCARAGFRGSGGRRRRSGTCGNWCATAEVSVDCEER